MCTEKDAQALILDAASISEEDPQRARKKYLEAAEIMILISEQQKDRETQCVEIAQQLFARAQTLKDKTPAIRSSFTSSTSKLTFADIGGLHTLKEEIRFKIIEPFKHPDVYAYFGKKIGGGILMYGPPGCGKSLIAEATSNEAGATFFSVKASDLKSKYVGETEKNIAELFKKAREKQPSIIFFDEFESLGSDRTGSSAHDKSAVAQLLTEMDGMGTKNQQILLLAATNEPWSIDPALLREGRFGRTLFIPPPDLDARRDILKLNLSKRPLAPDVSLSSLAESTELYSGADLSALCEIASDVPLRDYFKTNKLRKINAQDFAHALGQVKSVMVPWFRKAQRAVTQLRLEESFPDLVRQAAQIA